MIHSFNKNDVIALDPIWQWGDFAYRAQQIAAQLKQDNIHCVACWFEDAAQFACVMLACFQAKVRILLPPNLLPENKQWITDQGALLFDDQLFAHFGLTQNLLENQPHFDVNNQTEIWLKTSGSSGEPKILVKTAQQMWLESEAISRAIPFHPGEFHLVSSVSVQHHYGLSYRIMLPLTQGWSIGRKQLPYPEYLIAESLKAKKALWISSPALLTRLNLNDERLPDSALQGIISSGGVLPTDVANSLRDKLHIPVVECYGSTETGAIAFRADDKLWTPTPLTQVGLNKQGALWVESAWLNQREQTADAAELHQGQFQLLGRIDRIVKFGEKRISLIQVEQHLLRHPWIADCYLAQHPNRARPAAWIALTDTGCQAYNELGRVAMIKEIRAFLIQSQEAAALPRFWRFTQQLPRNSQSKISRLDFEQVFLHPQQELMV